MINRAFTNVLTRNVDETARFYESLLDLDRDGDFGWFVLLAARGRPGFALGIIDAGHETVPASVAAAPAGTILTFVVDDVERVHARATGMEAEILEAPRDLSYGQRRLLLRDPAGAVVDISSPSP